MPRKFLNVFQGESLKSRALRSSVITFFSFGLEQALRLAANLILTRILFPEAFGIMALVSVVLIGLGMMSDVGINTSIIQNKKGADALFRNTAWSVQIIRGFILWAGCLALAYPASIWYEEPQLFPILCLVGVVAVAQGFTTTSIAISNKRLKLLGQASVMVIGQVVGLLFTLLFAYFYRSVWALVWGNIISAFFTVALGHFILNQGFKHRWSLDRGVIKELVRFGKWIFFSSILGFFANNADKLILGKLLSISELGIYSIALALASLPWAIFTKISSSVLMPVYAEVQSVGADQLKRKVYAARMRVVGALYPLAFIMLVFGSWFIDVLYDERYQSAGWMVQILSVSFCINIATNSSSFYLGTGRGGYFTLLVGAKFVLMAFCMFVGGSYWGGKGVLYGHVAAMFLLFVLQTMINIRFRMWIWMIDIPALILTAAAAYFFVWL